MLARVLQFLFPMALVASVGYSQTKLAEPFPIRIAGESLDVEMEGGASPWVYDFDGDGIRDLMLGEAYDGRLRVYHNYGTDEDAHFGEFTLFQDGALGGRVPRNNGFCPQVADLDQDGLDDILTPAWYGMVYWFRQLERGTFDIGRPITDVDGNVIKMEWTFGVTVADWNADGKPDLIVGLDAQGDKHHVFLLTNISQAKSLKFAAPIPVVMGEQPQSFTSGRPAPVAADWDGDGLFDLLIGVANGSVCLFHNRGTKGLPRFENGVELVSAPGKDSLRGSNAKVCVVDWNLDGKLDLVIGDHGKQFEKILNRVEEEAKRVANVQYESALANWGRVFRSYSIVRKSSNNPVALNAVRQQLIKENEKQKLEYSKVLVYKSTRQYHGNVWVFLRQ